MSRWRGRGRATQLQVVSILEVLGVGSFLPLAVFGHVAELGARLLYRQEFENADRDLRKRGTPLRCSIAEILEGKASRIYGLVWKIGVSGGTARYLTYEMVRLGFELTGLEAEEYLQTVKEEAKEMTMTAQSGETEYGYLS